MRSSKKMFNTEMVGSEGKPKNNSCSKLQSNLFKLYHVRLHKIKIYKIPNVFDFKEEVNNPEECVGLNSDMYIKM